MDSPKTATALAVINAATDAMSKFEGQPSEPPQRLIDAAASANKALVDIVTPFGAGYIKQADGSILLISVLTFSSPTGPGGYSVSQFVELP